MRGKTTVRLNGLAATGYCASLKKYFHGSREHLIFTPRGYLAYLLSVPGNRHDVIGLYALLRTEFRGRLLGDCAYQPRPSMERNLRARGINMLAAQRSNAKRQHPKALRKWIHTERGKIERRIALFDKQFHAERTLNRSVRNYVARRWAKALAHNSSRHANASNHWQFESVAHYHAVA